MTVVVQFPELRCVKRKKTKKNPQSKRSDLLSLNAKFHPLQQTEACGSNFGQIQRLARAKEVWIKSLRPIDPTSGLSALARKHVQQ
jgi:hypothetical protein